MDEERSDYLIQHSAITNTLLLVASLLADDLKGSTGTKGGFRAWESVAEAKVMVEPYAMSNGLLTQSFKVKRQPVIDRYAPEEQ